MPKPTHAFIGKKSCGCVVAVCSDLTSDPASPQEETAEMVMEMVRDGYCVQLVTTEEAKNAFKTCRCADGQQPLPEDGSVRP